MPEITRLHMQSAHMWLQKPANWHKGVQLLGTCSVNYIFMKKKKSTKKTSCNLRVLILSDVIGIFIEVIWLKNMPKYMIFIIYVIE